MRTFNKTLIKRLLITYQEYGMWGVHEDIKDLKVKLELLSDEVKQLTKLVKLEIQDSLEQKESYKYL